MELCGAKTKDFYIGKEHECSSPALVGKKHCEHHRCKRKEPWGECGFQWSDGEKRDALTDGPVDRIEGRDGEESGGAEAHLKALVKLKRLSK